MQLYQRITISILLVTCTHIFLQPLSYRLTPAYCIVLPAHTCASCAIPRSVSSVCVHTTQHITEDPTGCFSLKHTLTHTKFAIALCTNTDTSGILPLPATHASRLCGVCCLFLLPT